ncbi:MAG: thioredoxin family protein [Candidatus Hydrothermarchaeales archaeon]
MSEILLELFTTPTIPQCSTARKAAADALKLMNETLLIERDVSKKENYQRAIELGIREVPTLVVNGKHQIKGTPKTSEELVRFINHGVKK